MNLIDFYNQKSVPVTSVNKKIGDVVLTATDLNAVSFNQIGITIPVLVNGLVPQTQLPKFVKLVNGKIISNYLPLATKNTIGGIKLGQGFQNNLDGSINAVGVLTKQEKQQKIDIIQTDGDGQSVLTNNGTYQNISVATQTRIQFNSINSDNDVIFNGNLPIVSLLSETNHYYVISSGDIQYQNEQTILHMTRFMIQENITQLNGNWIAFIASAIKYIATNKEIPNDYKKLAVNKALIYG